LRLQSVPQMFMGIGPNSPLTTSSELGRGSRAVSEDLHNLRSGSTQHTLSVAVQAWLTFQGARLQLLQSTLRSLLPEPGFGPRSLAMLTRVTNRAARRCCSETPARTGWLLSVRNLRSRAAHVHGHFVPRVRWCSQIVRGGDTYSSPALSVMASGGESLTINLGPTLDHNARLHM
jgi:hypothetical protein